MYADDNRDSYPAYPDWGDMGGKTGPATLHGGLYPMEKRPLNKYVPAKEAWHCPADKGDSLWIHDPIWPKGIKSCYDAWGNSYLAVWAVETLRVKHVTGNSDAAATDPSSKPIKTSEIARSPSNKLIQGDWNWWGDRNKKDKESIWHNYVAQYRANVLYGDSHTEFFAFPKEMYNWNYGSAPPPDPNWKWW
jgi:hypothetical protein